MWFSQSPGTRPSIVEQPLANNTESEIKTSPAPSISRYLQIYINIHRVEHSHWSPVCHKEHARSKQHRDRTWSRITSAPLLIALFAFQHFGAFRSIFAPKHPPPKMARGRDTFFLLWYWLSSWWAEWVISFIWDHWRTKNTELHYNCLNNGLWSCGLWTVDITKRKYIKPVEKSWRKHTPINNQLDLLGDVFSPLYCVYTILYLYIYYMYVYM